MNDFKKNKDIKGFTIVEMSIVMFIIAVLLSGIVFGQRMILQARILSTIKQINGYKTASDSFISMYGQIAGDLEKADKKIPDCSWACNTAMGDVYAGDGVIGFEGWNFWLFQSECLDGTMPPDVDVARKAETVLFWYELKAVNLIVGVNDECVNGPVFAGSAPVFGGGLPASPIGGGFWVGSGTTSFNDSSKLGRPTEYPILGNVFVMVPSPYPDGVDFEYNAAKDGVQTMTPHVAALIDRKMDDGFSDSGTVHAFGVEGSCFDQGGNKYKENVVTKDCGLIISFGY